MMTSMDYEAFQEIIKMLEEAGLNPQICNTPIPCLDASVQAGRFTDPGDVTPSAVAWMPEEMVNNCMVMIKVKGESMRDAGFSPGDRVVVEYDTCIMDGDTVVASIDGESTLKSYMTDEHGEKWLVPHNPDFEPIHLTEDMGAIRMGKVVQHIKTNPRMPYREIRNIVERSRRQMMEKRSLSREDVRRAIQSVAHLVNEKRKWYAVYRVLVDRDVLCENAYDTFVQWVTKDVPAHGHLPDALDLPRMATGTFSKPVKRWEAGNAPVSGKRFRDYCEIARCMEEEL